LQSEGIVQFKAAIGERGAFDMLFAHPKGKGLFRWQPMRLILSKSIAKKRD